MARLPSLRVHLTARSGRRGVRGGQRGGEAEGVQPAHRHGLAGRRAHLEVGAWLSGCVAGAWLKRTDGLLGCPGPAALAARAQPCTPPPTPLPARLPARLTSPAMRTQGAGDAARGACGAHAARQVLPPVHQKVFRARDAADGEARGGCARAAPMHLRDAGWQGCLGACAPDRAQPESFHPPLQTAPEIQRTSLVGAALYLKSLPLDIDVLGFDYLDAPAVSLHGVGRRARACSAPPVKPPAWRTCGASCASHSLAPSHQVYSLCPAPLSGRLPEGRAAPAAHAAPTPLPKHGTHLATPCRPPPWRTRCASCTCWMPSTLMAASRVGACEPCLRARACLCAWLAAAGACWRSGARAGRAASLLPLGPRLAGPCFTASLSFLLSCSSNKQTRARQ